MALKIPEWSPLFGGWGFSAPLKPEQSPASNAALRRRGVVRRQEEIVLPIEEAAAHYTVQAAWQLLFRSSLLVRPVVERWTGKEWARVEQHPFYDFWDAGCERAGPTELLGMIWNQYLAYGECFIRIMRDGVTRPMGWDVMPLAYSAGYGRSSNQKGYVRVLLDRATDELRYEYTDYMRRKVDVTDDTIHMRWGLALENPRRGVPPILPVLPHIFLSKATMQFWSVRMDHPTQVDFIVSRPRTDGHGAVGGQNKRQLESLAEVIQDRTTGIAPDRVMALDEDVMMDRVSVPVYEMETKDALREAEYAVAAQLGMDPDDLQFKAGLEDSHSYASVVEARRKTWQDGIVPILTVLARHLSHALLPEWGNADNLRVAWDYSEVRALSPLNDADGVRTMLELKNGKGISTNELREAIGYPPVDGGDDLERDESPAGDEGQEGQEGQEVADDGEEMDDE